MFASKDRSEPSCIVLLASLLIFAGKAWSLTESGSSFRCSSWVGLGLTQFVVPILTRKHEAKQKILANVKRSSLFPR